MPCQVWTTGFFDKHVVGSANALTGGIGNAGGGITYFVMPAVYESLVHNGLTPRVAWRVTFIVPGVLILSTAIAMLLLTPDCPTGKWSERQAAAEAILRRASVSHGVVPVPGHLADRQTSGTESPNYSEEDKSDKKMDAEAQSVDHTVEEARGEVIQKPTFKEIMKVAISPQTIVLGAGYFCSFGGELAINSILGTFYGRQFPQLGLQTASNWAAMFGLLNVLFRPLGGFVSDKIYHACGDRVWSKKILIHVYGVITGVFLIIIGKVNSRDHSTMFGLVAGMAFFLEGGNGLNFSLVPHVHPYANGVVSGFTGAAGNFGGIIFAIIFRYNGLNYMRVFWIMGIMMIGINLAVSWIKPIPKGQIGGH